MQSLHFSCKVFGERARSGFDTCIQPLFSLLSGHLNFKCHGRGSDTREYIHCISWQHRRVREWQDPNTLLSHRSTGCTIQTHSVFTFFNINYIPAVAVSVVLCVDFSYCIVFGEGAFWMVCTGLYTCIQPLFSLLSGHLNFKCHGRGSDTSSWQHRRVREWQDPNTVLPHRSTTIQSHSVFTFSNINYIPVVMGGAWARFFA